MQIYAQPHVEFNLLNSYRITVGQKILPEMVETLINWEPISMIIIVTDVNVNELYGQWLEELIKSVGYQTLKYVVQPGRASKSLATIDDLTQQMFEAQADRDSIIVNLGGGVVGDIGGFAAAIYMRGIRYIHIPTTLLAQVDSSIGGKVGINSKNSVNGLGNFHHPLEVWTDIDFLHTLPYDEYLSGLAEIVKYAIVLDESLFIRLEQHSDTLIHRDEAFITQVIVDAIEKKVEAVSQDALETGPFCMFTYGHELGHAIEVAFGYRHLLHGEAVAIGMQGSMWLSQTCDMLLDHKLPRRQTELLNAIGLPTMISRELQTKFRDTNLAEIILEILARDKKRSGNQQKWIIPRCPGHAMIYSSISQSVLHNCIEELIEV